MKLSPCPFCGCPDVKVTGERLYYVICPACDCYGPPDKGRDQAVQKWNHWPIVVEMKSGRHPDLAQNPQAAVSHLVDGAPYDANSKSPRKCL